MAVFFNRLYKKINYWMLSNLKRTYEMNNLLNYFDKKITENVKEFNAGFHVTYEVEETADVILKSNSGSGFWSFRNWNKTFKTVFYTGEKWDLRKKGVFSQEVPVVTWKSYTGPTL